MFISIFMHHFALDFSAISKEGPPLPKLMGMGLIHKSKVLPWVFICRGSWYRWAGNSCSQKFFSRLLEFLEGGPFPDTWFHKNRCIFPIKNDYT